ncbi:MAG: phage terminase large subunit [Balneola sp.]
MKITINTHGNEKQKQALKEWVNDEVDDIVYGGSKGSGKSYLGISAIFSDALMYPQTHYFIARKQLNDLRKHTIPSINEVFTSWNLTDSYYKYNGQDNYYTLYNGSIVYMLDAKYVPSDPEYQRFGSMQMTRGMIEEAGEFERDAKNNLLASVGRWKNDVYGINGKIIQTCNPAKNYLYTDYYLKDKNGTLPKEKRFIQAFPQDNKKLPDGYLEQLERNLSQSQKERLLYGNWEYSDDPEQLIQYQWLVDCMSTEFIDGMSSLGADVARFGDDSTVLLGGKGNRVDYIIKRENNDTVETAKDIMFLMNEKSISAERVGVDVVGLGAGTVDRLAEDYVYVRSLSGGQKAEEDPETIYEFNNLRSQMYWQAREDIKNGKLCFGDLEPNDRDKIFDDLTSVRYSFQGMKKIVIESKDDIKKRLGRSPDYGDAFVYWNWMRKEKAPLFAIG